MQSKNVRVTWLCIAFVVGYLAACWTEHIFVLSAGPSFWNASVAIALAFLLLSGLGFVPLVLVTNLICTILFSQDTDWFVCSILSFWTTLSTSIAVWVAQRKLCGILLPGSLRSTAWFAGIILFLPAINATGYSSILLFFGCTPVATAFSTLLRWWVADLSGLLIIVPSAMVFIRPWFSGESSPYTLPRSGKFPVYTGIFLGALLITTSILVFTIEPIRTQSPFHLCFVPVVWIAIRFGIRGAMLATLAVTVTGLISIHLYSEPTSNAVNFVLFEIMLTGIALGLGCSVNERQRLEARRIDDERRLHQMQKYESLGVLAGGIAHEFNNLLTSIIGNTSILRIDLPNGSPLINPLSQIEQASWRAAELCQQMLAYAGRTPPIFHAVDLSSLIEKARSLLSIPIRRNIRLDFQLANTEVQIEADAAQIRQLLTQLVVFASDSIGDRDGHITLSTREVITSTAIDPSLFQIPPKPNTSYLLLEMVDDGNGIPLEIMPRIFEPFFTTKISSQGLGLASMLGIVKAHRGALSVSSEPGKGSRFLIYFPILKHRSIEGNASLTPAGVLPSREGVVLVVDDEESVRSVVCRMVENLGYSTVNASNGFDALSLFEKRNNEIIFVLLDLRMPHMDGEEVFRNLHRINPTIPVVLMSGYSEKFSLDNFRSVRPAGFLAKPFDPAILRACLEQLPSSF